MEISIPAVIAQVVNFWILFFLFRKYLTQPIVAVVEERRALIKKLESAEQEYQKKIQEAEVQSGEIIEKARHIKEGIIADAGILAEKKKSEIIKNANDHADKIMKEANEKIDVMKKWLEDSYEESIKKTSILVLKKLIKKTPQIQDAYLQESIKEFRK